MTLLPDLTDEDVKLADARLAELTKPSNQKGTYSEELISIYTAFRDQVFNPSSVLYPSCSFDGSPAKVFPNVTFVDREDLGSKGCIDALVKEGLKAIKQDIVDYKPQENHDLLILLNPGIKSELGTRHIKSGGYIIANDWHGNATEMASQSELYELVGTIDFARNELNKKTKEVIISRNLTDLFVPVKNKEELIKYRPEVYDFLNKYLKKEIAEMGFDNAWAEYRGNMKSAIPAKRNANNYIFRKR